MHVLVPVDGSECSRHALEHAVDLVEPHGGSIDVVHFTDIHDEGTDDILEWVEATFDGRDVDHDVEVVTDVRLDDARSSSHVGRRILKLVAEREYDHVVMGHHGTGFIGKLILGSTAETVLESGTVPVTVVA